jgi:hypothetical protein
MSHAQTRKVKNPTTIVPIVVNKPGWIKLANTNLSDGREHFPRYDEIYCIFHNEYFLSNEKEMDA